MPHYRIRRAGIEFPVSGLPALVQMVGDGVLGSDDAVWDPGSGDWRPASGIGGLADAFARREALLQSLPPPRAPTFPAPSPAAEAPPPAAPREAPSPPSEAGVADGDGSVEDLPPGAVEPRGQVIRFPEPGPSEGALARQVEPDFSDIAPLLRQGAGTPPPPSRWRVRPMVVLSTLVLGGAFLLALQMHVRGTANRFFQPVQTARTLPTAVPGVPPAATAPTLPQGMADFYETLEDELRARMVTGDLEIRSEDALEMALMVELSRLKVDLVRVHAPILEWGGRKGDVPMRAEIRIWYESRPSELDRELAAIALVVGKYVQRFSLDVPTCEILVQEPDGRIRSRDLDPELARAFWLQRISLVKFLAGDEAP